MPITNAGEIHIAKALSGITVTAFDAAHAYMGVGDSTTAFNSSQTDLQASSNKLRKAMDAGYPQQTGNQLVFRATFGTGDANFNWHEWGIFNDPSAGDMLVRKVETVGSGAKTSANTWILTITLTISA